jgi:hypothetical protein
VARPARWQDVLREPETPRSDDALSDALSLTDVVDESDYDMRSRGTGGPLPHDWTIPELEAPPFRELAGGDRYLQTGEVFGDPYLPISPRTLRPTPAAASDHRWTLSGGAFWDHDAQARIEGPDGPVQRIRDRRARARHEADLVGRYVDRHRAELEPLQLQVFGLFFRLRLEVAAIAHRLRRSVAAIRQTIYRLRCEAGARLGGRPLRRAGVAVPTPKAERTPALTVPTPILRGVRAA